MITEISKPKECEHIYGVDMDTGDYIYDRRDKIAIFNLENKYNNLALEKVKKYYTDKGCEVSDYYPMLHDKYDKIYCSSIFTKTDKSEVTKDMICGGTGFDLTTKLPNDIECIKPKLNFGFTQRGCIRKCSFCVVPQKEGVSRAIGDIYDLWDGISKDVILFDNNILSIPNHFVKICSQLRKEKITVDWNQGLDLRILYAKKNLVEELKSIRHKEYRFSWDLDDAKMPARLEWVYKELEDL